MKFKKQFKIYFVWRRRYRQYIRSWQNNFINKAKSNTPLNQYFSWKQKGSYQQLPWYWQRSSQNSKK
jgi:hypothetical protein